jgi:hypothetical protein
MVMPALLACRGTNYVMWQPYRPEDRTRRFRFVLQVPDELVTQPSHCCLCSVSTDDAHWCSSSNSLRN